MAKISANGATKVETIKSLLFFPGDVDTLVAHQYTHTLCSDGRVLRKSGLDSKYTLVGRIRDHVPDKTATFRAYVKRFEAARAS